MSERPARAEHALAPATGRQVVLALFVLYLVWGSTYLGIRIVVEEIPPFLAAAVRFTLAGAILYALTFRSSHGPGGRPGLLEWRDAAIIGGCLLVGGNGLLSLAEVTVPSGVAALLVAAVPLWIAVLGRVAFGARLTGLTLGGIVLGFAGVAFLVWPTGGVASFDPFGIGCVLVSPILWSIGSLYSRRAHLVRGLLAGTAMQMLGGGAMLGLVGILLGEPARFAAAHVTPNAVVALVYLVAVGSLVGYTAYAWLLRVAPISLVATYAYVNPIVAVILGALVLAEPIEHRTLAAGVIIVVAVAIIVWARRREEAEHPEEIAETT